MIDLVCEWCGIRFQRSSVKCPHIYCGRACSGLARRKGKTSAQKKAEKAAYDREYRVRHSQRITARKAEYFQRTYDPRKAAEERKKNMARHVEYCRRPEYRKYKQAYDEGYRAKAKFGEFAESALLVKQIESEVSRRITDYEIRLQQGTLNKKQKRQRAL